MKERILRITDSEKTINEAGDLVIVLNVRKFVTVGFGLSPCMICEYKLCDMRDKPCVDCTEKNPLLKVIRGVLG